MLTVILAPQGAQARDMQASMASLAACLCGAGAGSPCLSCQARLVAELRGNLAEKRREIKQLSGQRLRVQKQLKHRGLGPVGVNAVVLAYWYSGKRQKIAAMLARQLALRCKWSGQNLPDAAFVQNLVGEVDISAAKACATAERCARCFIASVCLAVWIRKRNIAHGVAPSAQDVFRTYQRLLGAAAPRLTCKRSIHAWVKRWRKRWGFRRGQLRLREDLDAMSIRAKAQPVQLCESFDSAESR